jgi:hypothetical protein
MTKRKAGKAKPVKKTPKKASKKKVKKTVEKPEETKALAVQKPTTATPFGFFETKYSLIPTNFSEKQIIQLASSTPANQIYRRKGKGGRDFDYVKIKYIIDKLNFTFGWNWDFDIVGERVEGGQVVVKGKLTVRSNGAEVSKTQYGRADIKKLKNSQTPVDFGNDFKAAASDCLKKCASLFGIARDVYGKEEAKTDGYKPDTNEQSYTPQDETYTNQDEVRYEPVNDQPTPPAKKPDSPTIRQIKMILNKKGATTEAEALSLLEKEIGFKWKNFQVSDKAAELALKKLLNQ